MIWVGVDAMGGDFAPREIVHGACLAAKEYGVGIKLIGPTDIIAKELKRYNTNNLAIEIVNASQVVGMDEKPSKAILKKKDSSIVVAMQELSHGSVDAVVAAGSTGAAAVAAQLILGRIQHVDRSAIACNMPTSIRGKRVIVVDVGANVDCSPYQLFQFGLMGQIVSNGLFNIANPVIGLLNIGSEETKGNELVQETYKLFKQYNDLNFIGFIEGRDFPLGKVDVVVTDGFTGNVALKTAEGISRMISSMLKQELMLTLNGRIASILAKPAFTNLKKRIDHHEAGGALLVGVKGVCVIAHGGSNHTAIKNAVRVAKDMITARMVSRIEETLSVISPQILKSAT